MSSKTAGLIVAVVGVLVALFFALLDVIGLGNQGGVYGEKAVS